MVLTGVSTRASEAGHWYTSKGEPAYEVPDAKGNKRPATLRDARKLGLYPSVTTIIKCAAAPGLETWKQNQVLLAALTLPRADGESDESFCERIMRDSQEQARKARDRGTSLHASIQRHYEREVPDMDWWEHVQGVVKAVGEWAECSQWDAERSFAHPLGFGGKCDLSNHAFLLDFKTKEFAENVELKTWDEHAMQLAAYRQGLGIPGARCAIVYVSTTTPGLARVMELPQDELARGWMMFQSLLAYWQAKTGHYPMQEAA
jgi:hypothetical protein